MRLTASELKKRAKLTLSGNYGMAVGAMMISGAILLIAAFVMIGVTVASAIFALEPGSLPDISSVLQNMLIMTAASFVLGMIFSLYFFGVRRMFFNMSTDQPFSYGDLLFGFTHKPHRVLGIFLIGQCVGFILAIPYYVVSMVTRLTEFMPLMVTLQILMYLLLIVGSVVYNLYFGIAPFLLMEDPERTVFSCFRDSAVLMRGNKGRLFYLRLSMIGMYLLGLGSFGIGFLWIDPYIEATMIHFYLDITADCRQAEEYSDES